MAKKAKQTAIETYDGSTPLKSVMQEMFVTSLLTGITQREAYRQAGYKVSEKQLDSASSRLSSNIKIRERIAHLRRKIAKKLNITVERQCREFEKNVRLSRKYKQIGAANQALSEQSKLCGLQSDDKGDDKPAQHVVINFNDIRITGSEMPHDGRSLVEAVVVPAKAAEYESLESKSV